MKLLRRPRPLLVVVGMLVLVGGLVGGVAAARDAAPVQVSPQRIAVVDGPHDRHHVTLDATFYTPPKGDRAPAVLLAHGFGGNKNSVRDEAMELAEHGYAVLAWSARGFGDSTGRIALDSPDYEVKDVRQLIDWLADRPEVLLDHPGDPRIGIAGKSYGGAIALLTAAHDRRVDAIAPQITWYDLADAFFPNATGQGPKRGVFKKRWAALFFAKGAAGDRTPGAAGGTPGSSPGSGSGPVGECGRFLPAICAMYLKVAETGRPTPEAIDLLRRSSPSSVAGRIHAPTLLVQGRSDSLFPLKAADANARAITDAPVSVVWFQGGHDGGDQETDRIRGLVRDWFDRFLARDPEAEHVPGFTVTRAGGVDTSSRRTRITTATAPRYPGLSGAAHRTVRLTGTEQTVINPPGGLPASVSTLPGLGTLPGLDGLGTGDPDGGDGRSGRGGLRRALPGQTAIFDSEPLVHPVRVTGAPTVHLKVTGDATLFATVYDVGPDGRAVPTRRLATAFRLDGAATVTLPALDHRFERGHLIRIAFTTTDAGYATPAEAAAYRVSVTSPLTVPVDPALRAPNMPPPWWTWALPLVAAIIAAAIAATGRRGRRTRTRRGRPATDAPALKITGLVKRYSNGELAVDDLSLRVERGQVLGLLGPNGAGKTTTLRMLMGLIHPDSGSIEIFGRPVAPGAPVLSRLGSFVEGPGFLPHLSGRDNLVMYWRATGRPTDDAHMDEATEIAGLGDALNRAVRTYSQGMRQRLAIAQAMLGLPDLLVLDEPTNGLDPPQIAEMREVLKSYAAGGRTVIISSHLLAEVEQTCTHVVVMRRGTAVAAGPTADIVGDGRGLEEAFLEMIDNGR